MFTISTEMSAHAVLYNHFEFDKVENTIIRDNLNLYIFQMHMEIPEIMKMIVNVENVMIDLAVSASLSAVDARMAL